MTGAAAPVTSIAPSEPLGYRPALDGLRTIAVALVILYHGDVEWMPGGFLGVSVFFTLSGFLITALLLREWSGTGGLKGRRFWMRRFRRLTPAAWTTIAMVLVMGLVGLWSTEQLRDLRGEVPWAVVDLVNWYFVAAGTTYGDTFASPSPLEHFWSLAVEAQFYAVLFVIGASVLVAGRRRSARRRELQFLAVLALATAASVLACGLLARSSLDRAYFGTETRAAEMLLGAMLAVLTRRTLRAPSATARRAIELLAVVGMVVVLVLAATVSTTTRWLYPWGLLLTAVCSAALLAGLLQDGLLARVVGHPTLAALGRATYAIYLVHWPIFVWLTPHRVGTDGWRLLGIRLVAVAVATLALHRLVEQPLRHATWRPRPALAGLTCAALVLVGTNALMTRSLPQEAAHLRPREPGDMVITRPVPTVATTTTTVPTTAPAAPTASTTEPPVPPRRAQRVMLIGDSVATSFEEELAAALAERGVAFTSASIPGCGILEGEPDPATVELLGEDILRCPRMAAERQAEGIDRLAPDLVISLSTWESGDRVLDGHLYEFGTPESDQMLLTEHRRTRDRLTASGASFAWVLAPDPVAGETRQPRQEAVPEAVHLREVLRRVAEVEPRDHLLDLHAIVCPASPCPTSVNGVAYRPVDGAHFDDPVAASVVARALADQILALDLDAVRRG